jgi:short-subunit dehydrogenase
MQVSGTRVLVTGASGGIGQALALAFAEAGAELVVSGRREPELKALSARVGGSWVVADLAVRADVSRLLDAAADVDILVANAALPAAGPLSDFSAEQVDRALEVNLRAPVAMAHALAPAMVGRGRGSLVFVSSLAGLAASKGSSLYNATKFGLRGFALALRQDLHGTGVGVSVVLPGFVSDAGMFADSGATPPPGFGTRTPQQVAQAALDAVHKDKGEVLVAPPLDRVGARIGGLAPGLAARLQRVAPDVMGQIAAGQKDKR